MTNPSRAHANTPRVTRWITIGCILAWSGMLVCLLLVQAHRSGRVAFCPIGSGCAAVLASRYAAIGGVPLPWVGLAFYSTVLLSLLAALATGSHSWRSRILKGALWIAIAALSFGAILTYAQIAIIHAFCPLCVTSFLILTVLMAALAKAGNSPSADIPGSPVAALMPAIFAALAVAVSLFSMHASVGSVATDSGARELKLVDLSLAQISGPKNAKIQLVVFTDYTCQFCIELDEVLKRIRAQFPQDVMVASYVFPRDQNGPSYTAAIAAQCASEQGAFWSYHDKLFAEKGALTDEKLRSLAETTGLELHRFARCLRSEEARFKVEASRNNAVNIEIKGLPALFLNGTQIGGMVDFASLERRIRNQLKDESEVKSSEKR